MRVIAGVKRKRQGVGVGTGVGTGVGVGVGVGVRVGVGTEGGIEVEGTSFTTNGGELSCKSDVRSIGLAELVEGKVVGVHWEEEGKGEEGWLLLVGEMSKISFD